MVLFLVIGYPVYSYRGYHDIHGTYRTANNSTTNYVAFLFCCRFSILLELLIFDHSA